MQIVFQIGVLIAVSFLFYFAFKANKQQKYSLAIIFLVVGGFALRLYSGLDFYLHAWDERYHALVAKNMLTNPFVPMLYHDTVIPLDFKNWNICQVWLHKQPVPLWMMSAGIAVFGENEIAIRLPSIIFSCLGIYIIYLLALEFFNRRTAFLSAFLFAIHGLIIDITTGRTATDHIDLFFLIFILIAVFFAVRAIKSQKLYFSILSGVFIGLAILSKWLPALIVVGVWGILAFNKISWKQFFLQFIMMLSFATIVALPWQIYIYTYFPEQAAWEASLNMQHITNVLDNQSGSFWYHFVKMGKIYGELFYLVVLWMLYKSFKSVKSFKKSRYRLALLAWILVPYLFFSFTATKMQAYTLFAAPAIFISTAFFAEYLLKTKHKFKRNWLPIVLLIVLFALPIRYNIERLKFFEKQDRNPQWTQNIKNLKIKLGENTEKLVIVNATHPIETMFYINCIAYDFSFDAEKIIEIEKHGYKVIDYQNWINSK